MARRVDDGRPVPDIIAPYPFVRADDVCSADAGRARAGRGPPETTLTRSLSRAFRDELVQGLAAASCLDIQLSMKVRRQPHHQPARERFVGFLVPLVEEVEVVVHRVAKCLSKIFNRRALKGDEVPRVEHCRIYSWNSMCKPTGSRGATIRDAPDRPPVLEMGTPRRVKYRSVAARSAT